jgi:type II secretory pathway pseudopilin PulG
MIRMSRSNAGFSLVELAILMAIIGLIAATAMETYRIWVSEKVKGDTESRRELIAGALTLFLSNYGRLPCPTDPTLAPPPIPRPDMKSVLRQAARSAPATVPSAVSPADGIRLPMRKQRQMTRYSSARFLMHPSA